MELDIANSAALVDVESSVFSFQRDAINVIGIKNERHMSITFDTELHLWSTDPDDSARKRWAKAPLRRETSSAVNLGSLVQRGDMLSVRKEIALLPTAVGTDIQQMHEEILFFECPGKLLRATVYITVAFLTRKKEDQHRFLL